MESNHSSPPAHRQHQLPLLRRDSIGEAYHVLTFDAPQGIDVAPGQFCMVRGIEWGQSPLLARPMSFLTGGTMPSLLVKVVGDGTVRMARAEPGEPFSIVGPLGRGWTMPPAGKKVVLVAGGVGVAPLIFLSRALRDRGFTDVVALYGGRTARDLALDDELAEATQLFTATEDGSRGLHGRVTALLEQHLAADCMVYTCGPDRMMAAVAAICAKAGLPCEASLETPMACGFGVCLGCPVKKTDGEYLYACTCGPVVNAHEVDWSAGASH